MTNCERELERIERLVQQNQLTQAVNRCRRLVRRAPRHGAALLAMGELVARIDGPSAAVPYLRRAVQADSNNPAAQRALGEALEAVGAASQAAQAYRASAALAPTDATTHLRLGNVLRRIGSAAAATECFQQALTLDPQQPAAANDLANMLIEHGRVDEGLERLRSLVVRRPDFAAGWSNLAAVQHRLGQDYEALASCVRALELDPRHVEALLTLHNACIALGYFAQALAACEAALAIEPSSLRARYNRSLVDLALGNFDRGWQDYRLRDVVSPERRSPSGLPRWDGRSRVRSLLVRREQGVGTQLMFAVCLPALAERVESLTVECDVRLCPLLRRSFPDIQFLPTMGLFTAGSPREWRIDISGAEVLLGDVPGLTGYPQGRKPAGARSPIVVDESRVAIWRERLARLGSGIKVGFSWRGGGTEAERRRRSTALDDWQPLLALPTATCIALQYDARPEELAQADALAGRRLPRWPGFDPRNDLDDLAALARALDVVVTVDNSTAHVAAAVGARVWTLLPSSADWRWMTGRADTPWYPSMELVRPREQARACGASFRNSVGDSLQQALERIRRLAATALPGHTVAGSGQSPRLPRSRVA